MIALVAISGVFGHNDFPSESLHNSEINENVIKRNRPAAMAAATKKENNKANGMTCLLAHIGCFYFLLLLLLSLQFRFPGLGVNEAQEEKESKKAKNKEKKNFRVVFVSFCFCCVVCQSIVCWM